MADRFARAIVEVGFQQRDRIDGSIAPVVAEPITNRNRLGCSKSFCPAPYPMRSIVSAGRGPKSLTKLETSVAPVGVVSSPSTLLAARGIPRSNSAVAGAGNRTTSVGNLDESRPGGNRRSSGPLDAEQVPGNRTANDVGNRIDGANLMKMHLFDRRSMHPRLGLGQTLEHAQCKFLLPWPERAAVDHRGDMMQMAVGMLGLVVDKKLRRAEAPLVGFLHPQLATGQAKRVDPGLHLAEISPGIEERPQQHVAADAAGTIKVGNSHVSSFSFKSGRVWPHFRRSGFSGEPHFAIARELTDRTEKAPGIAQNPCQAWFYLPLEAVRVIRKLDGKRNTGQFRGPHGRAIVRRVRGGYQGMNNVTLRVLDGADRGQIFGNLAPPITIGREEGNSVQLNDERISRFHIKIQEDQEKLVLTDLESTNGTRVNGEDTHLRILRFGDVISLGRSVLLFGTHDEISQRLKGLRDDGNGNGDPLATNNFSSSSSVSMESSGLEQKLAASEELQGSLHLPEPPDLPPSLSAGQAAQLSELLEYLHLRSRSIIRNAVVEDKNERVVLSISQWQDFLGLQSKLAEYLREIGNPNRE